MKLFALKMKLEGYNKDRWLVRQGFDVKFSDDINKARLLTGQQLKEFHKYCEQGQNTFTFEEAWEIFEVEVRIVEQP